MRVVLRLSLIVGALVAVFFMLPEGDGTVASTRTQAQGKPRAAAAVAEAAAETSAEVRAIEQELAETGRVVRRPGAQSSRSPAEKAVDRRTTVAIEAQFAADPRLSPLTIGVVTTDGTVTLAGRVASSADVAHAIELALRHSGVREVISTLQVARSLEASSR
jgi:osmotically-inducible protein OsmY